MPDPAKIFDRDSLLRNRLQRRRGESLFLIDWCAKQLAERLFDFSRSFETALQMGGHGAAPDLADHPKISTLFKMGPDGFMAQEDFLPVRRGSLDLIASLFGLHTVDDLPGALLQFRQALKPDGLFIAAMPGGETLYELRQSLTEAELETSGGISPRVFPFADKQQMGALLQRAGFALPVVDSEIVTVTYENMFALMHDLRGMGEGNAIAARLRRNPGRAMFMKAAEHYARHFSETDGRIRASFEIIFLSGWSPHDSQQKPLRPGSAQNRLADILGTREIEAGENAIP